MRTMLGAGAMTALGALPVFLLSAQSVLVREDLDFSEPQLGLAVSAFFASAALTVWLAGSLVQRFGRRRSTILAGFLVTGSALGVALGAWSYGALLALLLVAGVSNAALQMTANVTLARAVPPNRQGLAFGVKQSAIPVSILLSGLAVPTLGVVIGWRWTYAVAAAAGLLVVAGGLRVARSPALSRERPEAVDRPPRGALVVSFIAMSMASAAVNSLSAFLPAWAFHVGMTPSAAGLLLAAASALSVLARVVSGVAADRRRGRNLPVVAAQVALGAVGFLLLAAGNVPALVAGAFLAFAIGWAWPGLLLFAVVRVGRDSPATASGAVQSGAFAGGAAGPLLFGVLVAATTYPFAWIVGAAVLLASAALLLVARRMFLRDLTDRPPRRPLDAGSESAEGSRGTSGKPAEPR